MVGWPPVLDKTDESVPGEDWGDEVKTGLRDEARAHHYCHPSLTNLRYSRPPPGSNTAGSCPPYLWPGQTDLINFSLWGAAQPSPPPSHNTQSSCVQHLIMLTSIVVYNMTGMTVTRKPSREMLIFLLNRKRRSKELQYFPDNSDFGRCWVNSHCLSGWTGAVA